MWLLNTESYALEDFSNRDKPPYAILSHRWSNDEATFEIARANMLALQSSFRKIQGLSRQALSRGIEYMWIDTCCINKQSSAELSEAINSMFQWYSKAVVCYVYLSDVKNSEDVNESFLASDWHKRGWTLQELIAPKDVVFYDQDWTLIGTKHDLKHEISEATGVSHEALNGRNLNRFSVAQRMSWAARRRTTRPEDRAYSLMGLFDVNIPLLYGEGEKAFMRLQEEIIKDRDDQSIFAWYMGTRLVSGLLAPSPDCFEDCGNVMLPEHIVSDHASDHTFAITNRGLSIRLEIQPWHADTYVAFLRCVTKQSDDHLALFLRRLKEDDQYARISLEGQSLLQISPYYESDTPPQEKALFVRKFIDLEEQANYLSSRIYGYRIPRSWPILKWRHMVQSDHTDFQTVTLAAGQHGGVVIVDLSAVTRGFKLACLGFDFDFHPYCILIDSSCDPNLILGIQSRGFDCVEPLVDNCRWCKDEFFQQSVDHNGILGLKGHRIDGLYVHVNRDVVVGDNKFYGSISRDKHHNSLAWTFTGDSRRGRIN